VDTQGPSEVPLRRSWIETRRQATDHALAFRRHFERGVYVRSNCLSEERNGFIEPFDSPKGLRRHELHSIQQVPVHTAFDSRDCFHRNACGFGV
jgi:hypothetical protein